jgi:hypothetical protein
MNVVKVKTHNFFELSVDDESVLYSEGKDLFIYKEKVNLFSTDPDLVDVVFKPFQEFDGKPEEVVSDEKVHVSVYTNSATPKFLGYLAVVNNTLRLRGHENSAGKFNLEPLAGKNVNVEEEFTLVSGNKTAYGNSTNDGLEVKFAKNPNDDKVSMFVFTEFMESCQTTGNGCGSPNKCIDDICQLECNNTYKTGACEIPSHTCKEYEEGEYACEEPPKDKDWLIWLWIGLGVLAILIILGAIIGALSGSKDEKK